MKVMEKELIVQWKIRETATSKVLQLLPELAEKTRLETGNISYTIYQSESDPNTLILHERYMDAAALEAHKNSAHYQAIVVGNILPHLEVRDVHLVRELL
jgi:quinol monooxygenase YgiN